MCTTRARTAASRCRDAGSPSICRRPACQSTDPGSTSRSPSRRWRPRDEWMPHSIAQTVHIGELGLDGRLRPVPGVLPAVMAAAREGNRRVIVPHANAAEASLVEGIEVVGAVSLADVARWHGADVEERRRSIRFPRPHPYESSTATAELADVIGQRDAVEALIAAAAGGHHMLMSGPPGAGKTMLASRLPASFPRSTTPRRWRSRRSGRSRATRSSSLVRRPPLEAPHHSASIAALVGGGSRVRPAGRDRARDARRAVPRRGGGVRAERARCTAPATRDRRDHDPSRRGRGILPRLLPADPRHQPVPVRQLRRSRCELRVPADGDPAIPREALGPAAGSRRHRARTARVSVAHAADLADGTVTTDAAAARVAEARARAAHRLRDTPVADQRPRIRTLAARRSARARSGRAPPDRRGPAARIAHAAGLRPRASRRVDAGRSRRAARAPPCTTSAARCS